jgi:hypothetical protein
MKNAKCKFKMKPKTLDSRPRPKTFQGRLHGNDDPGKSPLPLFSKGETCGEGSVSKFETEKGV